MGISLNQIADAKLRERLQAALANQHQPKPVSVPKDEDAFTGLEREMHEQFEAWIKTHYPAWPYIHPRMDKPSTIRKGFPDFVILLKGRAFWVEFKTASGKISEDQAQVINELQDTFNQGGVYTSVANAIAAVLEWKREFWPDA